MAVRDQARVLHRLPEQRRFGASGLPAMLTLVVGAVVLFLGGLVVGRGSVTRGPGAAPAADTPPPAPPPAPTWTGSGSATPAARRGPWPPPPTSPGCCRPTSSSTRPGAGRPSRSWPPPRPAPASRRGSTRRWARRARAWGGPARRARAPRD